MKTRTLLVLLGLFAILWGGLGYWAQTYKKPVSRVVVTSTATADWKIYINSDAGVEFKYPANYFLEDQSSYAKVYTYNDKKERIDVFSVRFYDPGSNPYILSIFDGPFPRQTSVGYVSGAQTYIERNVAGIDGVEVYGYGSEGHTYGDVFYFKTNAVIVGVDLAPVIEGHISANELPDFNGTLQYNPEIYREIRDSLSIFTNDTEVLSTTTDWKTYTNPNLGVSLQHPSNYTVLPTEGESTILAKFLPPDYVMEFSTAITLGRAQTSWKTADDIVAYYQSNSSNVKSIKKISVDGYDAVDVVTTNDPPDPEVEDVYVIVGNSVFYLDFNGRQSDPHHPDFEHMLTTMMFTN